MRNVLRGGLLLIVLLLAACDGGAPSPAPLPEGTAPPVPTRIVPPAPSPLAPLPPPEGAGPGVRGPGSATAPWSFVATADTWKDNPVFRRILQDAASRPDDLVVIGGDVTPQGRPEQFAEYFNVVNSYPVAVYTAVGNHDILVSPATAARYIPLRQSFDHQNAHFTLVDSSRLELNADDLAWIEQDLAATRQPLKFVVMHVPPFMPFPVPAATELQTGGPQFIALMEKYQVTAVFAGHLQAYQRMERNGIPYIISGGGGSPLAVPAFLGGRYHYVRVTVQGTTIRDEVVWLDGVMPAP